jgi:hypothetical protein
VVFVVEEVLVVLVASLDGPTLISVFGSTAVELVASFDGPKLMEVPEDSLLFDSEVSVELVTVAVELEDAGSGAMTF